MSQRLINRSLDLKRLRDEGYDIGIRRGHLLVKGVPYVDSQGRVRYGILGSTLDLANDITVRPTTHVALFSGDHPCHKDGSIFHEIAHSSSPNAVDGELVFHHSFSSKPPNGYADYYEKMTTYVGIISGPAQQLEPSATARTFPVIVAGEDESIFQYVDTASSRAGINAVSQKLEVDRIAIIGGGGTGSYILDLVSKTPAREIHVYDGDTFSQHNAFRSPGAPSKEQLAARPKKVAHLTEQYSKIHRRIIPHPVYVDESNVEELRHMNFVFLSLDDRGRAKRIIVDRLLEWRIPFIDVGMGVELCGEALGGILRVTTSTNPHSTGEKVKARIPFPEDDGDGVYDTNIQVADLNMLNAALAVIKWKKLCGFYRDLDGEHFMTYTVDGNNIINEDKP